MTDRLAARTVPIPHAPWYVPAFSPLLRFLLARGVRLGPNALVTIRGRSSGVPRTTPLAVIEDAAGRWIWSPWGDVHWVRNLRAAGEATVMVGGRVERVTATELSPAERLAFFRDTLAPAARRMRLGVAFVRLVDGVDINHPAAAADGRVVFELSPAPRAPEAGRRTR